MRRLPISNPVGRFASEIREYTEESPDQALEVYEDQSASILSENDSPDLSFRYSVNPYRGCFHACAYCYARPTHEYLGFGAGTDFDRKIVVKPRAAELLRKRLSSPRWNRELLAFSGVTDCYQPLEASLRLTEACLRVCLEFRTPVAIVTKSPVIERDVALLKELDRAAGVHIAISIPFANDEHARAVEPFVTPPSRRFRTIETLARAGLAVGVNVAPVIPGLTEDQVPEILERARDAGAAFAGTVILRLPGSVEEVFHERIRAAFPDRAAKIFARIRDVRGGALNQSAFGSRMRGEGPYAEAIRRSFEIHAKRLGLCPEWPVFEAPAPTAAQLSLF